MWVLWLPPCFKSPRLLPRLRVDRNARAVRYGIRSIPESLRHSGEHSYRSVVFYGEVVDITCNLSLMEFCSQFLWQHLVR